MSALTKDERLSIQALYEHGELSANDLKGFSTLEKLGFVEHAHSQVLNKNGRSVFPDSVYRLTDKYFEYAVGEGIRDNGRAIARYMMELTLKKNEVCNIGFVPYDDLIERFGFPSPDYCHICLQYLQSIGCLKAPQITHDGKVGSNVTIEFAIIDFLAKVR